MIRRFLSGLIAISFFFVVTPIAHADDSPLLTWERGKEQNIVFGGTDPQVYWQVKMLRPNSPQIIFEPSGRNSKDFLVYSAQLPRDLNLGRYQIYVFKDSEQTGKIVAQVNVIEMVDYALAQSPRDLGFIFFILTFLFVVFSVLKVPKYSHLSLWGQRTFVETGVSRFKYNVPQFVYPAYNLRAIMNKNRKRNVLDFQYSHEGDFIHKISPIMWAVLPYLGALLGVIAGLNAHNQATHIPIYIWTVMVLIGVFDAWSGFIIFLGFLFTQILSGQVLNLRALLALCVLGLGWAISGAFCNFLYMITLNDFPDLAEKILMRIRNFFLVIIASACTGVFFFGTQILANSLSINATRGGKSLIWLSMAVACSAGVKLILHSKLNDNIRRGGQKDSLFQDDYDLHSLVSFPSVILITFIAILAGYHWTQSLPVAFTIGIFSMLIASSFTINFKPPIIPLLNKLPRNIYLEATAATYLNFLLFTYIETLPYTSNQKTNIFILSAFLIPAAHRVLSIFHTAPVIAEKVVK